MISTGSFPKALQGGKKKKDTPPPLSQYKDSKNLSGRDASGGKTKKKKC